MRLRNLFLAAASVSLAASPALAAPASTAKSVPARAATSVNDSDQLHGGSGIFIAIGALAAIIVGIIVIADDNNDSPASP